MQNRKNLFVRAIKSPIITKGDNLFGILKLVLKMSPLQEKDILVITSKVVAITQGRVRKIKNQQDFDQLVKAEADQIFTNKRGLPRKAEVTLTIKDNIFIPWAGIDRSNIEQGYAVLWPKDPFKVAATLQKALQKTFRLKKIGVIISDSFCVPLRRGVSAVTIGYAGFMGVNDLRGKKDLYGKPLKISQQAVADNLATAAHLIMGEANQKTPFAIIKNAPVEFTDAKVDPSSLEMKVEDCLFAPLYV